MIIPIIIFREITIINIIIKHNTSGNNDNNHYVCGMRMDDDCDDIPKLIII